MPERPTIDDVARLAGVSKATVSLAYSGRRPVARATQQRIRDAADTLRWTASPRARALATARTGTVGLALARRPEVLATDGFFPRFIAGCESVLAEARMGLVLTVVGSEDAETAAYERYATGQVDGVLLLDVQTEDRRLRLVRELGLPAAVLSAQPPDRLADRDGTEASLASIHTDDAPAVGELVELLVAAGHRRIAHVSGPSRYTHATARRDAFVAAVTAHGLDPTLVVEGDFSAASGRAATAHLLALTPRPTAVVYGNDQMAYAGLSYARSRSLRVPEDLSITGFDDDDLSAHLSPALTTVSTGAVERGAAMAEALLRLLDGDVPRHRLLDCTTVQPRDSIAPPPAHAHPIDGGHR